MHTQAHPGTPATNHAKQVGVGVRNPLLLHRCKKEDAHTTKRVVSLSHSSTSRKGVYAMTTQQDTMAVVRLCQGRDNTNANMNTPRTGTDPPTLFKNIAEGKGKVAGVLQLPMTGSQTARELLFGVCVFMGCVPRGRPQRHAKQGPGRAASPRDDERRPVKNKSCRPPTPNVDRQQTRGRPRHKTALLLRCKAAVAVGGRRM